ncbi:MAG: division/cell wall cluster transcriptional repressor MraZ [Pseudomonadota bacterium]|nr:division/cell wall cluster transcriptional repressor MraZ [Pseudomonadota bacterium]
MRCATVEVGALSWVFVANFVFQGPAALTLDNKGRLTMPARHLTVLRALEITQLTITKHPDGPLMVFPRPTWEEFRDRINALPMEAVRWKRVFLGNAMDVDIDASSRVLIAPELRKSAGLDRDVMLIGMGSHLELWDAALHAAHEAEVVKGEMPDALKGFTF